MSNIKKEFFENWVKKVKQKKRMYTFDPKLKTMGLENGLVYSTFGYI